MMGFGELSTAAFELLYQQNSFPYSPKLKMFWGRFYFPQQNLSKTTQIMSLLLAYRNARHNVYSLFPRRKR